MNRVQALQKMLEMQKELDTMVFSNNGVEDYPLQKASLAYRVELAELANELQSFKYWKKNKNIDTEKVKDEYADVLHFALSLAISDDKEIMREGNINQLFENVEEFSRFLDLEINYERDINMCLLECFDCDYHSVLLDTLVLGYVLGFSMKDIFELYSKKNEINWERQARGY